MKQKYPTRFLGRPDIQVRHDPTDRITDFVQVLKCQEKKHAAQKIIRKPSFEEIHGKESIVYCFLFFRISFFPLEPVYIISNSKVATTSGSVIWFTMVTTNAW